MCKVYSGICEWHRLNSYKVIFLVCQNELSVCEQTDILVKTCQRILACSKSQRAGLQIWGSVYASRSC